MSTSNDPNKNATDLTQEDALHPDLTTESYQLQPTGEEVEDDVEDEDDNDGWEEFKEEEI